MIWYSGKKFKRVWHKGEELNKIFCDDKLIFRKEVAREPTMILNIISPSTSEAINFKFILGYDNADVTENATIDWGDGTAPASFKGNEYNTTSANKLAHTYSKKNEPYQITIKGWIGWNGEWADSFRTPGTTKKAVRSIELPTNSSPIRAIKESGAFFAWTNLESVPNGLFDNCIDGKSWFDAAFSGCSALKTLPAGLFKKCTYVTSCNNLCYNSGITSIPEKLFEPLVDFKFAIQLFANCKNLTSIPEKLFDNNKSIISFTQCFINCTSITEPLPEFWKKFPEATGTKCFNYCDNAPNYIDAYNANWADEPAPPAELDLVIDIQENNTNIDLSPFLSSISGTTDIEVIWGDGKSGKYTLKTTVGADNTISNTYNKGTYILRIKSSGFKWNGARVINSNLSDYIIEIKSLTNNSPIYEVTKEAFYGFDRLRSIPDGLFDKCTNITDLSYCFQNCSQLRFIPNHLFDNCTKVTTFRNCFYGCSQLQSIPMRLFDKNTLANRFEYCFYKCTALQSIPMRLFDNCTNITGIFNCFQNCSQLQSIPEHLFDKCINVIDFGSCFSNCRQLQSVPENLFDNCTRATNFGNCFYFCDAITSNLPPLWITHSNATHNLCFYNCVNAPNYSEAVAAGWT